MAPNQNQKTAPGAKEPHPCSSLDNSLSGRLRRLQSKDRYRHLRLPHGIDLSSNDYLGLANHPHIRKGLLDALESGISLGSTGSRLLRGNTSWHQATEARVAAFMGSETALLFNSGYDANTGVIATLCGKGDAIFSDALVHASTIDGIKASGAHRFIFPHNNIAALAKLLKNCPPVREKFIVVESLYSMEGDLAPLPELSDLATCHGAHLVVDEAHATGIFGPTGAGLVEEQGLQGAPLVSIHTCGKALGGFGAFISCSRLVREYLINHCRRFIFTTALNPLNLVHLNRALDLIQSESWRRAKALEYANGFRNALSGLIDMGRSESQIVPLILGSDRAAVTAARVFQDEGFDVRAIRPPTVPMGTSRLRVAFNAKLTAAQFNRFIKTCQKQFSSGKRLPSQKKETQ